MKMSISLVSSVIGYLSSVCTSLSIFLLTGHSPEHHEGCLFIFGDSILDCGTNNYINTTINMRGNAIPYGESFFSYPTGRFSDGRLIPDFIAEYAGLPLLPPYLQPNYTFNGGVNFASAGAGALAETYSHLVVDLGMQLQQFEQLKKRLEREVGDEKAQETISNAVYLVGIGGNDLDYAYTTSTTTHQGTTNAMIIGNVTHFVKSIHDKGGRKFGFLNVMSLGCTPYYRASTSNGTCEDELNIIISIYNLEFSKALDKLDTQLHGFKYSIFYFYNNLQQRVNYPSSYGIDEVTIACCGTSNVSVECGGQTRVLCKDPSKYVFFDRYHPTQKIYKQLADLMWTGGQDVIRPYNLRYSSMPN